MMGPASLFAHTVDLQDVLRGWYHGACDDIHPEIQMPPAISAIHLEHLY